MNHVVRIAALLIALGLLAQAPIGADANTEGDWAGGWNTWKNAAKGDWIETSQAEGIKVRTEVKEVSGSNITYVRTTYNAKGEVTGKPQELTKEWNSIKLTIKLPYNVKVAWTVETLTLSGVELTCDVATYSSGETASIIYYCKEVPCGGFVKSILNGKDNIWVSAYHTEKSGEVKEEPKDPVVATKSQLPRFYAAEGNSAIIKISGTGREDTWQLRTMGEVAEAGTKYSAVGCDEAGTPLAGAKPVEREQTKADWDKLYVKPSESGVKLKVAAGEFICDVFKTTDGDKETTDWISEGAPVKKVIKSGATETVMEAVKITMR